MAWDTTMTQFRAGSATDDITPADSVPMSGYSARENPVFKRISVNPRLTSGAYALLCCNRQPLPPCIRGEHLDNDNGR